MRFAVRSLVPALTGTRVKELAKKVKDLKRAEFVTWQAAPGDRTLGVVDFSIFPHLDGFPDNTLADAERWVAEVGGPAYAIDDQTAIRVTGSTVKVVSEGRWELFP